MKSNVNIVNHPLHPILVLIPAGSWIASLVLDIIFLVTSHTFWFVAAMWVMVIGIGGAVLAALAGFVDLFTLPMKREPKATGLWHMTLNLIITILYIVNVAAIRVPVLASPISASVVPGGTAATAFVLNAVGVLLLVVSGWLGGELVYRFGIAVPRETIEHAPQYETRPERYRTAASGALGGASPEEKEEHKDDKPQQ